MYDEVVTRHWFRSSPQLQRGMWQGLGIVLAVIGGMILFTARAPSRRSSARGSPVGPCSGSACSSRAPSSGSSAARWRPRRRRVRPCSPSPSVSRNTSPPQRQQIAFEEASNIFSRYLPYAVVFGVADRWASTFADVAQAAEAAGQPILMPSWYIWSGAAFPDFGGIASGVESFSTTSTGTFTSTPGSSGSSGFSGGGGFSGSGGGGSSSGSW